MAVGPCIEDSPCIDLSFTEDENLRADLVVSPDSSNCATCNPDGLYVPCHRSRFSEGVSNTPLPYYGGSITSTFGGIRIDLDVFADNTTEGTPIVITDNEQLQYTNNSGLVENCRFEFILGQTELNLRAGYRVKVGVKATWFGVADIAPVSGLYSGVGLGCSSFDEIDAVMPPFILDQNCEIAPGETLTLQWRMWAQWERDTAPEPAYDTALFTYYGAAAHIYAWTKG